MGKTYLQSTVAHLGKALENLSAAGVDDHKLVSRYAEYVVALKLTKEGYKVEVKDKKAYLHLPNEGIRIEVKSGKISNGVAVASFGKGKQIKDRMFDYCVFVTFRKQVPTEFFVFTCAELSKIADSPRKVSAHPTSNPCLLFKYNSLQNYEESIPESDRLRIELELHKKPEKFMDRWKNLRGFLKPRLTHENLDV